MLWTMLLSCNQESAGVQVGDVLSIRVEPTEVSLVTRPETPVTIDFVAYATLADGQEVEMDLVSWTSSNLSAGSIDEDGFFETVDTNGGITNVIANSLGVEGVSRVTVVFSTDILESDISAEIPSAFSTAQASDDAALTVLYPLNNVIIPRNLEGLGFKWSDDANTSSTVYRVRASGDLDLDLDLD